MIRQDLRRDRFLLFIFVISLLTFSCDSPKPKGFKGVAEVTTANATGACDDSGSLAVEVPAAGSPSTADAVPLGFNLADAAISNYDTGVKPILDNRCAYAGCHVAGGFAPDLSTFVAATTGNVENSIIARAVTNMNMPNADGINNGGDINDIERDVLQTWANLGFPEKPAVVTPPPEEEKPVDEDEEKKDEEVSGDEESESAADSPEVNWSEVASIFDDNCTGCHSTDSKLGGIILDDESIMTAELALKVASTLKSEHQGVTLDADDQALLAGLALTLQNSGSSETEEPEKTADPAQVGSCSAPDVAEVGSFDKFLNPPELTACHAGGTIYDRRTKACHSATLGGEFQCNWDGVKTKFAEVQSAPAIDQLIADKWQVDQCGEQDGKPVVFLLLPDTSEGFLNLSIKVLTVD